MKNLIGFILMFVFVIATAAGTPNCGGPVVDVDGNLSTSGKSLHEWFKSYHTYMEKMDVYNAESVCFLGQNDKLIIWEVEKRLKNQIFKLDFFMLQPLYVSLDQAFDYLARKPPQNRNMIDLLGMNNKASRDWLKNVIQYALWSSGQAGRDWLSGYPNKSEKRTIKLEYERKYRAVPILSGSAMKQKIHDEFMKWFIRDSTSFSPTFKPLETWCLLMGPQNIIRDILKKKAINKKNTLFFCRLVAYAQEIDDDLAKGIISEFKLDTPSPQISNSIFRMIGANKKLTAAILKSFKYMKAPASYDCFYYAVASTLTKRIVDPPPRPRVRSAPIYNVPMEFLYTYANAVGDYNQAMPIFFEFTRRHQAEFPSSIVSSAICKGCWNRARALLYGNSNLTEENARKILLNASGNPLQDRFNKWPHKISTRFARLLDSKEYIDAARLFDFNVLPPKMQDMIFQREFNRIKRGVKSNRIAIDSVLKYKSLKYKKILLKYLLEQACNSNVANALSALGPYVIPELIKIAETEDDSMSVNACKVIGTLSIYGIPAAPGLRKLLQSKRHFTVKIAAMCALAEIGDRSSVPLMRKYFKDRNRLLAKAARQSVCMLLPVKADDPFFTKMLKNQPR